MARIRTIKPEFWTDPSIMECSLSARLLLIGMLNFADDKGNIEGSAKMIKVQVLPADDVDVSPLLEELVENDLLIPYTVNGRKYYHIKGFTKHQQINRPSPPRCPLYEDSLSAHGGLTEDSRPEGKGREGKGKEEESVYTREDKNSKEPEVPTNSDAVVEELNRMNFESLWGRYPVQIRKEDAYKSFKATVKNAGDLQQINMALDKYLKHLALPVNKWKSPQNGDTWFDTGWKDFVNWREPKTPEQKGAQSGARKSGKFHGLDDKDYRAEPQFGG